MGFKVGIYSPFGLPRSLSLSEEIIKIQEFCASLKFLIIWNVEIWSSIKIHNFWFLIIFFYFDFKKFKAFAGWCKSFLERNDFGSYIMKGEKGSNDEKAAVKFTRLPLKNLE